MVITQALAELKTLAKRIEKKREQLGPYYLSPAAMKDPMESAGGTREWLRKERQSVTDMEHRIVQIRVAIQQLNLTTALTVGPNTRTIAGWLTWRKEVYPGQKAYLDKVIATIAKVRDDARKKGRTVAEQPTSIEDVTVNVDEAGLLREAEELVQAWGELDGQLSLLNATTAVPGL